jgi:hypothetical protein
LLLPLLSLRLRHRPQCAEVDSVLIDAPAAWLVCRVVIACIRVLLLELLQELGSLQSQAAAAAPEGSQLRGWG